MDRFFFAITFSFFMCKVLYAQEEFSQRPIGNIGGDAQGYMTGAIVALRYEHAIKKRHAINARAGYNIVRHRDLGVQDDERGGSGGFFRLQILFKRTATWIFFRSKKRYIGSFEKLGFLTHTITIRNLKLITISGFRLSYILELC